MILQLLSNTVLLGLSNDDLFDFLYGLIKQAVILITYVLAITWTNANPSYWRIYAALGGDELS